jgi:hypothetical protein
LPIGFENSGGKTLPGLKEILPAVLICKLRYSKTVSVASESDISPLSVFTYNYARCGINLFEVP